MCGDVYPEDLTYLKNAIDRHGDPGMLVHLAQCNRGKTYDGVVEGGTRWVKGINYDTYLLVVAWIGWF